MSSAKLYTSTPVVDRLSGTSNQKSFGNGTQGGMMNQSFDYFNIVGDKAPIDMSSFVGSLNNSNATKGFTRYANKPSPKDSVAKSKDRGMTSFGDSKVFQEFMARQEASQQRAKLAIDEVYPVVMLLNLKYAHK
jgi:hypothetical protein